MSRLFAALGLFALALSASADDAKKIQVRWYGQSFFTLTTTTGTTIAFDPQSMPQYNRPTATADVVCISHEHDDHNQIASVEKVAKDNVLHGLTVRGRTTGYAKIDREFKDLKLKIRTVPTYHDQEEGVLRGKNAVFVVEADGLKFVFLGDLGHLLSDEQVKAIGPADVLFIPIGGIYTLNGDSAKKVVAQLKPRLFILPMHYGTKVFDELSNAEEFREGFKSTQIRDLSAATNLLEFPPDLKQDAPSVVLLGWQK